MTAYTIKPLVWEDLNPRSIRNEHYIVADYGDGFEYLIKSKNTWFHCDSLAHGKQLCQQHWESEAGIGKFLEAIR